MACTYPQRRNWFTGRCKTPCKNHQAINPITGRCVSKTYLMLLHELGHIDDEELDLENDGLGRSHGMNSIEETLFLENDSLENHAGEKKSDLRDGLVEDSSCYPRKRNLLTGKCKTPCESYMAINPATGQCVTKRYLRTLDFTLYDVDEDDTMAANILFTPSVDQSVKSTTSKDLKKLITTSAITIADARTLRGVFLGSQAKEESLVGIYNHSKRSGCDTSAWKSVLTSNLGKCGIVSPQKFSNDTLLTTIQDSGNNFTWVTGGSAIDVLGYLSAKVNSLPYDLRLLIINETGILRLLVPKNVNVYYTRETLENLKDPTVDNLNFFNKSDSGINLTIHKFNKMTLV